MKEKRVFKNLIYIFFSLCFACTGFLFMANVPTLSASAEDSNGQVVSNEKELPFLLREEITTSSSAVETQSIRDDTFLYYNQTNTSNQLRLSFDLGNRNMSLPYEIYNNVYFPNKSEDPKLNDTSTFTYFDILTLSVYYNGTQILKDATDSETNPYIVSTSLSFPQAGLESYILDRFEMNFVGKLENEARGNEVGILQLDENGSILLDGGRRASVKEGVYTISMSYIEVTCNDSKLNLQENPNAFEDTPASFDYNFYILSQNSYLENNRPIISYDAFDHDVALSSSSNAYYLYSNYSSKGTMTDVTNEDGKTVSTFVGANKIPYVEYDFSRYDVEIAKTLSGSSQTCSLYYDVATRSISPAGDSQMVHTQIVGDKCRIYFTDVGDYTLTLNAIKLVNYAGTDLRKYNLPAVTRNTRKVMVYMFGYQASFTDYDAGYDQNHNLPLRELKEQSYTDAQGNPIDGKFSQSADVTSLFLSSNRDYHQNGIEDIDSDNPTFTPTNIIRFLNEHSEIEPVKTNQAPIEFTSNASLNSSASYVFSTKQVTSNFSQYTGGQLNGKDLYFSRFEGRTEGTDGIYIYFLNYRYANNYYTEQDSAADALYSQIFYFEITTQLPSVQLLVGNESDPEEINSRAFTNQDVMIVDTTKDEMYKKDVTVQVYAWDYTTKEYRSDYGGVYGISLKDLCAGQSRKDMFLLTQNAYYTIRLFYSNTITSQEATNILSQQDLHCREMAFTIDKQKVQEITIHNVEANAGRASFRVVSSLSGVSTNQKTALSWKEKDSGAKTEAYYRYFPIKSLQYYPTALNENTVVGAAEDLSNLLDDLLNKNAIMPVNYALDLGNGSSWRPYKTNNRGASTISGDSVLTDEGLYILDIFDEAGNHSYELFVIDYTTPMFALDYIKINEEGKPESVYELIDDPKYITSTSRLNWGEYKGMYVQNFTSSYFLNYDRTDITENPNILASESLYKLRDGSTSLDIFNLIYDTLFSPDSKDPYLYNITGLQMLNGSSSYADLTVYNGMYFRVPINDIVYYIDENHVMFTQENNTAHSKTVTADREKTYRLLIRDESNTKLEERKKTDPYALEHYQSYYSATQTLIVSFDSSGLTINHTVNGKLTPFTSNLAEENTKGSTKTIYLSPTSLDELFTITFTPTIIGDNKTIQVNSVTMDYYAFKTKEVQTEVGNETRYYNGFSENKVTLEVFNYDKYNTPMTDLFSVQVQPNNKNITTEGKYVITRTYKTDDGFSYNEGNDFKERTFVFYVDRNGVVTDPVYVGSGNNRHMESLVGGDIFVSMYDGSSIAVTFPNSDEGNTNNVTIFNNNTNTDEENIILPTNKVPVNVYVPAFKYTQYVERITNGESSYYALKTDDKANNFIPPKTDASGNKISQSELPIQEYVLYATIDKKDSNGNWAYYASTQSDIKKMFNVIEDSVFGQKSVVNSTYIDRNGFLRFYRTGETSSMPNITDAGDYRVTVTQGYFSNEIGKPFQQSISFQFRIEDPTPNFEVRAVQGNKALNSTPKGGTENNPIPETYYTNQAQLRISWDAPDSKYMAEIDIPNITITANGRTVSAGTNGSVVGFWGDESQSSWPKRQSDGTYLATLDLRNVGSLGNLYRNGQELSIKMRYKSPYNNENQSITKNLVVDLSAPSDTVEKLVDKTLAGYAKNSIARSNLRTYSSAISSETPTDLSNTSYNESTGEGNFAYFSYAVDKTFLTTLKDAQAKEYETYLREVSGKYSSSSQESTHETFLIANYNSLNSTTTLKANTYYEVVETDRAGNMSIYTIYVADKTTDQNLFSYQYNNPKTNDIEEGFYTSGDYAQISKNNSIHNIYSPKGFTLQTINYFGDAWAQIRVSTTGGNSTYVMLPQRPGFALELISGEFVRISTLLTGLENNPEGKAIISIYDRIYNQSNAANVVNDNFYFNVRNTSLLYDLTEYQNREYITFDMPTDDEIKSTQMPYTYLTYLQITANGVIIYEKENKVGFASLWEDKEQQNVSVSSSGGKITFELNADLAFDPNTRIDYIFRDNYGQENRDFHLYRERIISNPYTSANDYLYAYYYEGNLFYITKNGFQYSYNASSGITVEAYDFDRDTKMRSATPAQYAIKMPVQTSGGISTVTFNTTRDENQFYDDSFVLVITYARDPDNIKTREVFFTLYNSLPTANETVLSNNAGQFKIQDAKGTNVTNQIINSNSADDSGYFSELRLLYRDYENPFLSVKYSLRKEDGNWEEVSSGQSFVCTSEVMETYYLKIWYEEKYENEYGSARYIFGNVPQSQIYQFKLSPLTSAYWVEKTVGGVTTIVEKDPRPFISGSQQYTSHYIVNLRWADRNSVQIKVNKEQNLRVIPQPDELISKEDPNVRSELYRITNEGEQNATYFDVYIVISYIPNTNDIVKKLYTYNLSGSLDTTENLHNATSKSLVIPKIYTTMDRVEIEWSHHYGIEQNEIDLELIKIDSTKTGNFIIKPTVYTRTVNGEMFKYTYLTYSGKYTLKFSDSSGNVHLFSAGNTDQTDKFTFIFLKDVPFTLTYTDIFAEPVEGESEGANERTILPIKQAIYNSAVTLKIDPNTLSEFYAYSGTPTISVKRNGEEYTDNSFTSTANSFTFANPGYYEVTFSATSSLHDVEEIREETYQFTILNPDEYKISYVYNKYSNYYIEKIIKDGQDVTQTLLKVLGDDTITVNGKTYLAQLSLSYLDEKTGEGEYIITVNSNNSLLANSGLERSWTYKVNIKSGTAPIRVSLAEGESTTGDISITFNQENIFSELGECTFRIVRQNDNNTFSTLSNSIVTINASSAGEITKGIASGDIEGTYYMQFVSPSDYLLFSYKVVKTTPMNAASIIAIVISAVVLVAVIFIIFKLRKRISVK